MIWFRKAFNFFVYSSLYIALCCVIMCLLTFYYAGGDSSYYLLFAFCGTLCSYNFHWYLTRGNHESIGRARWSLDNRQLHLVIFLIGLAGAVYAFFHLLYYWQWLFVASILTFLYSAPMIPSRYFRWLKNIAVGKTAFLAFAWSHVTVNIPIVMSGNLWAVDHYILAINRFFFIFSICILFDHRDRDADSRDGIRSMITQMTDTGVNVIFWITNIIVVATTLVLMRNEHWFFMLAFLIPTLILAIGYRYFKRSDSDFVYYFILDGLMMLSGLIVLIWINFFMK